MKTHLQIPYQWFCCLILAFTGTGILQSQITLSHDIDLSVPANSNTQTGTEVAFTFIASDFDPSGSITLEEFTLLINADFNQNNSGNTGEVTFIPQDGVETLVPIDGVGNCANGVFDDINIGHNFGETCFDQDAEFIIVVERNGLGGGCTDIVNIELVLVGPQSAPNSPPSLIAGNDPLDISLDISADCAVTIEDVKEAIAVQYEDNVTLSNDLIITVTDEEPSYDETCSDDQNHTITFTVADECGNVTDEATIALEVNDVTGPTFSNIPDPVMVNTNNNCSLTDANLLNRMNLEQFLTDNCDEDATIAIVSAGAPYSLVDMCTDEFDVMVQATDACGQTSVVTTVSVLLTDNNSPDLSVPTDIVVIDIANDCTLNITQIVRDRIGVGDGPEDGILATDACNNIVTYMFGNTALFDDEVRLLTGTTYSGDNFFLDTGCDDDNPSSFWVKATDECNNESEPQEVRVMIQDVTPPNIDGIAMALPNGILFRNTGTQNCAVSVDKIKNFIRNNSSDVCTPNNLLNVTIDGDPTDFGRTCLEGTANHVINFTVADDCGNESTGSFELRVNDAPTTAESDADPSASSAPVITITDPNVPFEINVGNVATCDISEADLLVMLTELVGARIDIDDICEDDPLLSFLNNAFDPFEHFESNCGNGATRRPLRLQATDACGNVSEAVDILVDFIDLNPPTVTPASLSIVIDDSAVNDFGNALYPGCMISRLAVEDLIKDELTIEDNCSSTFSFEFEFFESDGTTPLVFLTNEIEPTVNFTDDFNQFVSVPGEFNPAVFTTEIPFISVVEVEFIIFEATREYLPPQCQGDDAYTVRVIVSDNCTENEADPLTFEVSFIDDTDPTIFWDPSVSTDGSAPTDPIVITETGDCGISGDDVFGFLFNGNCQNQMLNQSNKKSLNDVVCSLVHFMDNCIFEIPTVALLDGNGMEITEPLSAKCGENIHDLILSVTDACGLEATSAFQVEIIDSDPFPDVSLTGIGTRDIDLAVGTSDPFPLTDNGADSTPDALYGGGPDGNPNNENEWHTGNENGEPAVPRFENAGTIQLELDPAASCGIDEAALESQVMALLNISDNCTDTDDLLVDIIIRENDSRFDQDDTNDINLSSLNCGDMFGIIIIVSDDCSSDDGGPFQSAVGVNAEVVNSDFPVFAFESKAITILTSEVENNPCVLSEEALLLALLSEIDPASNMTCGDISLSVSFDDETTDDDENGPADDAYSSAPLEAACEGSGLSIILFVTAQQSCGDIISATSEPVLVQVFYVDDTAPVAEDFSLTRNTNVDCTYDNDENIIQRVKGNIATDNCTDADDLVVTLDPAGPYDATCPNDPMEIMVTISDGCTDNETTVTLTLTVNDNTAPTIDYDGEVIEVFLSGDRNDDDVCVITDDEVLTQVLAAVDENNEPIVNLDDNCGIVSMTSDVEDFTYGCGAGMKNFMLTVIDACGISSTVRIDFVLKDNNPPILTVPAAVTIGDDPDCRVFKSGVESKIINDPAYSITTNCGGGDVTVDVLYVDPVTGEELSTFELPVICPGGMIYDIIVRATNCDGYAADDQIVEVTITDNVAPVVAINPIQTITLDPEDGCAVSNGDMLNIMINRIQSLPNVNNLTNANTLDACTADNELTFSIAETDPSFSADCDDNLHMINFSVTDQCGNAFEELIMVTIEQSMPGPSIVGPAGIDIVFDDPLDGIRTEVYPLPPTGGSSTLDALYGGFGDSNFSNAYHDELGPIWQEPCSFVLDEILTGESQKKSLDENYCPIAPISVSLDVDCGLTMADLRDQILAELVITDVCTTIDDDNIEIVIRENDERFDLDATNDIDLSSLGCGAAFGVVVIATDDCGLQAIRGYNIEVIDINPPVLVSPSELEILRSMTEDCRLNPTEIRDGLQAAGLDAQTGLCGDLILELWLDDPSTDIDENGEGPDFYEQLDNADRLSASCAADAVPLIIYIRAAELCNGQVSQVSEVVEVSVSFIDDYAPVLTTVGELTDGNITRDDEDSNACGENIRLDNKFIIDLEGSNDPVNNCNGHILSFSSSDPSITFTDNDTDGQINAVFPVGTTPVSVVATDACGNSSDPIAFEIIIIDVTNPSFNCGALRNSLTTVDPLNTFIAGIGNSADDPFEFHADIDECSASLEYTIPVLSDACGVSSVTIEYFDMDDVLLEPASFADVAGLETILYDFPVGNTQVVITATDVNGLTRVCRIFVSVIDVQQPTLVNNCQAGITVELDAITGGVTINPSDVASIATDACGIDEISIEPSASFSCSDLGSNNPIQITLYDEADNSISCFTNVTVEDNTPPTLTFSPNEPPEGTPVILDCGEAYQEEFPIFSDNCTVNAQIVVSGSVDVNTPGQYFVSYDAMDIAGNPATTLVREVIVGNTIGGVDLTIDGEDQVCAGTQESFTFSPSIGSLPSSVSVNWAYTGNQGTVISGQGTDAVTINFGDNATSGDVVVSVVSDNNIECGFVQFTYAVEVGAPVALCIPHTVNIDASTGLATITADDVDGGSDSPCGPVSLSVSPSTFSCTTTGMNEVTLTVTDENGVSATCTSMVYVIGITVSGEGIISGNELVCTGQDGFSYTLNPDPGVPVQWSHVGPDGESNAVINNNGTASIVVNFQDEITPGLVADGLGVIDGNNSSGGVIQATWTNTDGCSSTPITSTLDISYLDDELCSVYNCFIDLHVNTGLAAANSPDLYVAEERISSDGVVTTTRNIEFRAGKCIELKPGFEVEMTAEFLADIAPCVTQQAFTNQQADQLINALDKKGISLDKELLNIVEKN